MQPVNIGLIGLGNVGEGTLTILTENAAHIETKLGFPLRVAAVCSRGIATKHLPAALDSALKTPDWRDVVNRPDVDIVVELIGGATTAREIIDAAIANGKSVVTANKELMALAGAELWDRAIAARINLAMEASVAGGIPIHAVLREGISATASIRCMEFSTAPATSSSQKSKRAAHPLTTFSPRRSAPATLKRTHRPTWMDSMRGRSWRF